MQPAMPSPVAENGRYISYRKAAVPSRRRFAPKAGKRLGEATHIVKPVATAHSWRYESRDGFDHVLKQASDLAGNDRIHGLGNDPHYLHRNYYKRKVLLNANLIQLNLDNVEELIYLLLPLCLRWLGSCEGGGLDLDEPPALIVVRC